ncbi:MAG: cardiolipin synthase [Spirochaetes bacterium]|nr:cardiolipin synthase [Spirochaetota bacterium]
MDITLHSQLLTYIFWINALIAIFIIILDNRTPQNSISWILLIIFLPIIGLTLFIIFGINWKKTKLTKQSPDLIFAKMLEAMLKNQKHFLNQISASNENENNKYKLMNLLLNSNNSILTLNNSCKIYNSGEDFFEELLKELKNAKSSIHMEFFIWTSDKLGEEIKNILIQKVNEGVEVRLIFDGVGSFGRISYKYRSELKKAGVKYKYYLGLVAPFSILKINYSNHRKIVVIDGEIAYTGGMNVGNEYITGGKRFKSWKDTQIKLTGDSVKLIQTVFLVDWYNSGNKPLLDDKYFPKTSETASEMQVQIATSGADSEWYSIHQMYFTMIANANKEIYIQTPYFVPDQSIMNALETAALSGVSVNILMTGIPDKKIPFWAAHTYFKPLLKAGANIFLYKKGFMHSKIVIIDGNIVSIGSCNFDIRSFHINYEMNAVIYDSNFASEMIENFYTDLKFSETVSAEYLDNLGILKKIRNSATRLLSPIM